MPLPQTIPIDITPDNVWAILDAVESDFEDDLADVMEDSDTEFVIEDEQEDNYRDLDVISTSLETNQALHAIVHNPIQVDDTDVQHKFNLLNNTDTTKEIHLTKLTKYIKA